VEEETGVTDELVAVDEARRTAEEALNGEGRVGDVVSRHGAAYVFAYHPYPGAAGARGREGALVTVTPLDGDHVRVQVAGVTVSARARVRRDEAAGQAGPTGADE
jgi:hypothetical protein